MAAVASSRRLFSIVFRRFSTSPRLHASAPAPSLCDIGRLVPATVDGVYEPGQVFIHRVFAYKGIVVCSFDCKVLDKTKKDEGDVINPYYQVLIHRGDWAHIGFPIDITAYLGDGGARQERPLTTINGMDCVAHADILPLQSHEKIPIDHDLFPRIFLQMPISPENPQEYHFEMRPELKQNYLSSAKSWLAPCHVYKETTENVEVTVTTFYLGANVVGGQQRHCWRYVVRIENLEPTHPVILRERNIKVFSLNHMHQMSGRDVVGTQPELGVTRPAFQYSSMVDFPHPKGAHMWGKFRMERDDGTAFEVSIPTTVLESVERLPETVKTVTDDKADV